MKFLVPGLTAYLSRLVTPCAASSSSSMKKLPVVDFASLVRMKYAASARMSGVRHMLTSTPGIICSAAVAIAVRGHRLLTAMPYLANSPEWPSVHMLMPYLAIVYAVCGANQCCFIDSGGDMFTTCGLRPAAAAFFRCGRQACVHR